MKRISVLMLFGWVCLGLCAAQSAKTPVQATGPLRDGTLYSGIEGAVSKDPERNTWYFAAATEVTDGLTTIPAGEPIEMLPCSTLEKIIAATGQDPSINGKLWARVTRYSNRNVLIDKLPSHKFANRKAPDKNLLDSRFLKEQMTNENFLFAIYFIPLTADEPAAPATAPGDSTNVAGKPAADEIIPEDVLKQLDKKRVVDLRKIREMLETEGDVVLADRIGFVTIDDNAKAFTVDSLGRNVEDLEFTLLSCEALEYTEKNLIETPAARQRFRVSGIVTTFRGQTYILLQRAVRTYSHGNFAR